MKAILGLVNGFVMTQNTRGRGKSPVVVGRAKRGGLRGIRRVLMGSKGRWLAMGLALTLLHIDLAPAVASTELARSRGASVPSISLTECLASLLLSVSSAVSQLQISPMEVPPLAPAPGLPPAWGASASVYGGVVNLGNGNLCLQVPLGTAGVGFSLVFNSQANPSQPSPIAPKWTHSWNVFVEVSSDSKRATVQEGDGSRWVYRDDDLDGVFVAPQGVFDRLVRESDGRYVLVRKGSEERWVFAPSGALRRLERVEDKYGRSTVLSYDGNGRLQSVVDRYGRALGLEYQGARLWKVRDFAGREWTLKYYNECVRGGIDDEPHCSAKCQSCCELICGHQADGCIQQVCMSGGDWRLPSPGDCEKQLGEKPEFPETWEDFCDLLQKLFDAWQR